MRSAGASSNEIWRGPRHANYDAHVPDRQYFVGSRDSKHFAQDLEDELPALRRFARRRAGGHDDLADDLVQETLLRAWSNQDKFASGSNLAAWLVVILRNAHISLIRKRHREQVGLNEGWEDMITTAANQEDHVALTEVLTALDSLSACDHDILRSILVDCSSHRELALRHDCALGTIRSRLSRARGRLAKMLL